MKKNSGPHALQRVGQFCDLVGKSILELDVRKNYHVSIVGVKQRGKLTIMPSASRKMEAGDHLMVIGKKEDVDRILEDA